MYRDDTCAVCGESLPPDHLYCREHAATVDDRVQEVGALLPRTAADLERLATQLEGVAQETWDFLAEAEPDEPEWPPVPDIKLSAVAEDVDVDVGAEPGTVDVRLRVPASVVLAAVARALGDERFEAFAAAAAKADGLNATH